MRTATNTGTATDRGGAGGGRREGEEGLRATGWGEGAVQGELFARDAAAAAVAGAAVCRFVWPATGGMDAVAMFLRWARLEKYTDVFENEG